MEKTTTALATPLREQLDKLAAFEPTEWPVLSLYLNMRADQHGQDNYEPFLRKTFSERPRTLKGAARKSFERDTERIREYLAASLRRSTNGLAIFACSACGDFFETVQLEVPLDRHDLFIGPVPHLYPLARLNDQYPRYAAALVDTNSARLFVFGLGTSEKTQQVANVKTRRTSMGGWSQARYQRHADNFHLHHMKEVVSVLDRLVREEQLNHIVIAADEAARPILMAQLPRHLADKVVDVMALDIRTPQHQVLADTLDALRRADAVTDAEHVSEMLGAWRAGGLAVAGPEDTLEALAMRQVEELLITARPERLGHELADELVTRAQQNSARIRFIEDHDLLSEVGGVGALLRFKI